MTLPKGHTELSTDPRPIQAIYWPAEGDPGHRVGQGQCTRIEAYDECGSMSHVPWIAVFFGEVIAARVPADQVTVVYF